VLKGVSIDGESMYGEQCSVAELMTDHGLKQGLAPRSIGDTDRAALGASH
jgi:hypothetical protein